MKQKLHKLIPAIALAIAADRASAQMLYEPFNYNVGNPLDNLSADVNKSYTTSGTFWNTRGTTSSAYSVGTGLTSLSPLPTAMGASGQISATNTGATPTIGFGQTVTSGDVYYSFLLKTPGTLSSTTAGNFAGFANFAIPSPAAVGTFQAPLRLAPVNTTSYKLALGTGANATFSGTINAGDTVFVVARYRIVAGSANDLLDLWINPTTSFGGAIAPATSVPQQTNTSDAVDAATPSSPMIAGLTFRSYSATNNFQFDEVRVDSTWAGVAPDGTQQFGFNNAAGGSWSGANWNDYTGAPTASNPNALGQVANFGAAITTGSTITVDGGGKTIDTLNFTNTGSLTLSGQPITFSSNASAAQVYGYAGSHTISAPITMASNLSFKMQTGATITVSGAISGAGKTLGIYGNGTGTVKLGGNDLIDHAARLEVRSGNLDLNGNNVTVDTFQLGTGATNNGIALGGGTLYDGDLASGNITGSGVITANSYDLQSGTIASTLAGTTGVTKSLAGSVTLSGANTYSGNTVVNSGVLTLTGSNTNTVIGVINVPTPTSSGAIATLAVNSDAALGPVPGVPTTVLTISSTGGTGGSFGITDNAAIDVNRKMTILAGVSGISVSSGKTGTFNGQISGSGSLSASGAGTLVLTNATNDFTGNLLLPTGGTAQLNNVGAAGLGTSINFTGGTLKTGASLGSFARPMNVTVAGSGTGGTIDTNGFDTTFTGAISGTSTLLKTGAGTAYLTQPSTFAARWTVGGGSLRISDPNALGTTAGITQVSGGAATGALELDGAGVGGMTIAEPITLGGKNVGSNTTPSLTNISGNNTLTAPLVLTTGGVLYNIKSDGGKLTIGDITNTTGGTTDRSVNLYGAALGEITGSITNVPAGGNVSVTKFDSGTWTMSGVNTYTGPTTVNTGNLLITKSMTAINGTATSVAVSGGKLQLVSDGSKNLVIHTGAVSVTGGKFDLSDNKLITTSPVGTVTAGVYDGVTGLLQSGRNGGGWAGSGIVTSQTQATTSNITTLGVASAAQVKGIAATATATFAGQTVGGTDTLVMYTYGGDANLDGKINVDDYTRIDFNVPLGSSGWYNGDFNYDGKINVDDYTIIDFNVGIQGAQFPTAGGLNGVTAVPEPTSITVLALAGLGAVARRRRRQI